MRTTCGYIWTRIETIYMISIAGAIYMHCQKWNRPRIYQERIFRSRSVELHKWGVHVIRLVFHVERRNLTVRHHHGVCHATSDDRILASVGVRHDWLCVGCRQGCRLSARRRHTPVANREAWETWRWATSWEKQTSRVAGAMREEERNNNHEQTICVLGPGTFLILWSTE